jgi:G:T-mismatch repair DNA endonuclease (very short patch repair protein)
VSRSNVKLTTSEFINKAYEIHKNLYDYSNVEYVNNHTGVCIICRKHGPFKQIPSNHLNGKGCKKCAAEKQANKRRKLQKQFIKECRKIHKNNYDYSKVEYVNNRTEVEIVCPIHGSFRQTPIIHLRGCGCKKCGNTSCANIERKKLDKFISDSKDKHLNKYDYSKVNYINAKAPVEIICLIHGSFWQSPNNHLHGKYGQDCPKCSNRISKPEFQWLDSLNLPDDKDHRNVRIKIDGKLFKVDGYDPITNTIYEFNGDYFHGNPKIFPSDKENKTTHCTHGELYARTLLKEQTLKNAGYNVISIWESDFKESLKKVE